MENIKRNLKERIFMIWKNPYMLFPIFGFVFTSLAGTLLHFLPDVASNNFIYLLSPSNESVWEHLKLLFYPYVIFIAVEYFAYGRETKGFLGAKMRGVFAGEGIIIAIHYIVSGIMGRDIMWVDVLLFFVGAATAYLLPYLLIKRGVSRRYSNAVAAILLLLHAALFCVFTFFPPKIGLFFDPEMGGYGIT